MAEDRAVRAERVFARCCTVLFATLAGVGVIWNSIRAGFVDRDWAVMRRGAFSDLHMTGYWAIIPGVIGIILGGGLLWIAILALVGKRLWPQLGTKSHGIPVDPTPYREKRKARKPEHWL